MSTCWCDQTTARPSSRSWTIPEELHETVFEPFYTTKPTGQGTGLGLSLSYKIIEDHNGTLKIDSQVGLGTRVIVKLPLQETERLHESLAHH